ncbi:MAG: NAD-dependent epimerase/dehydratase family protein [Candidatus Omnitrophica bacterium]|nr:NAD-dependent epimerase/dehydratase family protein [Candidatus Omnitrophota bacterium]MCB9747290.1 NAD-dependent epimerase/dehydratase family protein [Candidatus Omnitrophota bacterium]
MKFFKNKKILVTGAAGFVGTNLLQALLPLEANIRAVLHQRESFIGDPRIHFIHRDLTSKKDCQEAVADIDYIFHCAASTSGAAVIANNPLVHVTPNIIMNAQLLEAAYHAGVKKFLWIGSSTGYPPPGEEYVKEERLMDSDPYDKYFAVGWMKRYAEVLCRMYAQKLKKTMTTIVLRPTNIYGEYDDFEFATSHVFAALLRKVVERHQPIEVWGDGNDVRDLIYVGDFIQAMLTAMEKVEGYEAFNIGGGQGYCIRDLLQQMLEIDGYQDADIVCDPSKPTMIPIRLVDISKAKKQLGFVPTVDLESGIKKTMEWYRSSKILSSSLKNNKILAMNRN